LREYHSFVFLDFLEQNYEAETNIKEATSIK
jgi:hypothetical protein